MDNRLTDIKAREQAATPGPWTAVELPPNEHHKHPAHWVKAEYNDGQGCTTSEVVADCPWEQADAEFTAHARTDVPWLVEQVEQARRWAAALEAQLALSSELRIPTQRGSEIVLIRHDADTDRWSIKDGGRTFRAWVNGQWRHLGDISLDDAFTYPLHEALDTARQLANGGVTHA